MHNLNSDSSFDGVIGSTLTIRFVNRKFKFLLMYVNVLLKKQKKKQIK